MDQLTKSLNSDLIGNFECWKLSDINLVVNPCICFRDYHLWRNLPSSGNIRTAFSRDGSYWSLIHSLYSSHFLCYAFANEFPVIGNWFLHFCLSVNLCVRLASFSFFVFLVVRWNYSAYEYWGCHIDIKSGICWFFRCRDCFRRY